jgi:hypothetical protein
MHRTFTRSRTAVLLVASCVVAALALPTTASAIISGAESNGLLVNSNATPEIQAKELDRARAQGVHVMRANFGWSELAVNCGNASLAQQADPENGCYNWAVLDSLVSLSKARGIDILLSTSGVPNWLQPKGCAGQVGRCYYMGRSQGEFNKIYKAYGAFLHAAALRYRTGSPYGTVKYWTIWNEPNSDTFWKPKANAARYAQLVGYAAQQLKRAFPGAKVGIGPTAPRGHAKPNTGAAGNAVRPGNFIKAFQAALPRFLPKRNPRKFIDAWAHNPYPLVVKAQPSKPNAAVKLPTIGMNNFPDLLKALDAKPITKGLPVWATEFGWETLPDEVNPIYGVSRALQAQYMGEAYDRLSRLKRVQIGIWYGLTDGALALDQNLLASGIKMVADWQAGTWTALGVIKPSFYAYQRPISVPMGFVKKGTRVPVWGKSNLKPSAGKLVWCTVACTSKAGKAKWHWVTGTKRNKDGDITASFRITQRRTYFAVYDGLLGIDNGYGRQIRMVASR